MLKQYKIYLPVSILLLLVIAGMLYGAIPQEAGYHNFADKSHGWGIDHVADVFSNLGFALVALWGYLRLAPQRNHEAIINAWSGYRLFLMALFLTALGSSYYHLAPDNARLVWDRIPIALACAGLLAGVAGDVWKKNTTLLTAALAILAIASVAWWYVSEMQGFGDLRFYLFFQVAALILIPLWQWIYERSRTERLYFGMAMLFYVMAKVCEVFDYEIAYMLGTMTGHALKHILATAAAALIVQSLIYRMGKGVSVQTRENNKGSTVLTAK